jgi:hypothetical protein
MHDLGQSNEADQQALPDIPLVDVGKAGPVALLEMERGRAESLIAAGRRQYLGPVIDALDCYTRGWARRSESPYLAELESMAAAGLPGGLWFMNFSFEWGCTSGAAPDPAAPGVRLLRTLDWPFHGLGRHVLVARQEGPAGASYNITWAGFVGVITAMAPGRFSVAINQAPVLRHGPRYLPYPWPLDWVVSRVKTFRGRHLPPAHLLRRVIDHCQSFSEACRALSETPLALPAFFTVAGTEPEEACVIERLEEDAFIHRHPAAVANHWLNPSLHGHARGIDSEGRLRRMRAYCAAPPDGGFEWLSYPVLNSYTRLAVVANAAGGELLVQGFEADGPATRIFDLKAQKFG